VRRRLDLELVRRGLASSQTSAQELIARGAVTVSGATADKPARLVDPGEPVLVVGEPPRFVSRGGLKLAAALDRIDLPLEGSEVLDAGASTGGFTDCLIQRGVALVVAVDVGHGQLHERLRVDERVVVLERTNIRDLPPFGLPTDDGGVDGVVADLSFISLLTVLPALHSQLRTPGWMVVLVKPQFEAGRAVVDRAAGVVRDPSVWSEVLGRVSDALTAAGGSIMDIVESPVRGAAGNVEFLIAARFTHHHSAPGSAAAGTVSELIDEAVESATTRWIDRGEP